MQLMILVLGITDETREIFRVLSRKTRIIIKKFMARPPRGIYTCENDRRCVWSLRRELLGSVGRRRCRLIRHLRTRAEVARIPAAQFATDINQVVLRNRQH